MNTGVEEIIQREGEHMEKTRKGGGEHRYARSTERTRGEGGQWGVRTEKQIEKTDGEAVGGEHMEKSPCRKQGEKENSGEETRRAGGGQGVGGSDHR